MRRRTFFLAALLVGLALASLAGVAVGAPPQEASPNEVAACRVRITGFSNESTNAAWHLEKQGSLAATISRVVLRYPTENGAVNTASLNGTFWNGSAAENPAVLVPNAGVADDWTLAADQTEGTLTIGFANAAASGPYHITVTFTQGCMATFIVQPPAEPVSLHGLIETIDATGANEGTLTVETARGTETVNVTAETKIIGDRGIALTLDDLQVGMVVAVQGTRAEDGSVDAVRISARLAVVEFIGTVLSLPVGGTAGEWRVGAATVTVDENTQIEGEPQVGSLVRVTALRQGEGSLRALRITALRDPNENQVIRFRGPIESFSETEWIVAGVTVQIDASTMISGTPEVGRIAEVHARVQEDSSLLALHIRITHRSQGEVVFRGPIREINTEYWIVGAVKVNITSETAIEGTPAVGLKALVRGQIQPDRSVTATSIKVEDRPVENPIVEFVGTVSGMPAEGRVGEWSFSEVEVMRGGELGDSVTVMVDARTTLDESRAVLEVGAKAWVKAVRAEDGTLQALRIRGLSD